MKRRSLVLVLAIVAGSLAVPTAAMANTTEAIAETGGMTLALLGSSVTVNVTLDQFGNLTDSVGVIGGGFNETSASDHKVRFATADGVTKIDVKAKKGKLSASVRSAALDDLKGDHVWSAEVFEDATAEVRFTISNVAGDPQLSKPVVTMTGANAGAVVVTVKEPSQETDDDDEAEAKATVVFTMDGFTKTLLIKVEVDHDDDGDDDHGAKLKVELRGKDRQVLADSPEKLAKAYTWDGLLCDGTTVSVAYVVHPDGTVTFAEPVFASPGAHSFETKALDNGFRVSFDEGEARLTVQLKQKDDGTWQLKVDSKTTERCGYGDHKDDHKGDDRYGDHHEDDDHQGDRDGDGHDKNGRDDHDD
ncbi:MAG: hypothetical protein OEM84_12290 [Acidimicrobiia bacterium]|nr:hypothetical protein [Acidimicrobiia bacterium]MDH5615029.1 hypothetical protein [Acidimicrobiia bacterium]